ncbi:MAG: hypothetical protein K0S55_1130, partial [Clostridia bacterium]|nr:hypothetical protein [Clostridia bacterium]
MVSIKKRNSFISFLLIGFLCFIMSSACTNTAGENPQESEVNTPESEEAIDLNGEVFTFRAYDYLLLM